MQIVVLDGYTLARDSLGWASLSDLGEVIVYDRCQPEEIRERAQNAHVLITNKARIDAETIAAAPNLQLICLTATGFDCVDIRAARARGIPVCNVPEYGTDSVAQFTIALILELAHRVGAHSELVREGEWAKSPDFCFWNSAQIELAGLTLGIVGCGRIGSRVAQIATCFGMRVIGYSRTRRENSPIPLVTLEQFLRESDVVSLHCPSTPETNGIVNRAFLAQMKRSSWLINTSRGKLVVEGDLAEALITGQIAGAALDVLSSEPPDAKNPLIIAPNCLITPHIAWATTAARKRLMLTTRENIQAMLIGSPINQVNK